MITRRGVVIVMGLLGLLGCQFSTKDLPRSLNELEVLVRIEQLSERQGEGRPDFDSDRVTAELRNKKHVAIETDAVHVSIDGQELESKVSTGNYGEHHPWHELDTNTHPVVPDHEYAVSLRWTDGADHALGALKTPKHLTTDQFSLPEAVAAGAPLTLEWRDLEEACEIWIYRTHSYADSLGNRVLEAGSANDPEAIRKRIGPGLLRARSGAFPIPQSYLAEHDGKRVTGIGVDVVVEKSGPASRAVSRASRLLAVRRVVLRCSIGEDPLEDQG